MKTWITLIFTTLIVGICCAQNTDSLELELQSADDSLTAKIYHQLIRAYEYSNPKKAIEYSQLSLTHPHNQEDNIQARTLINLGKLYKNVSQYDSAVKVMLDGIRIGESIADYKMMAMGYNSLGVIFKINSEWDNALKYYKLSNEQCVRLEYPLGIGMTLSNIGTIYSAKNVLDSAMVYYKQAAQIGDKYELIDVQATAYNNMGELYAKLNQEEKALPYFFKTLQCDSVTNNLMGSVLTLLNIANSYKVLQDYPKAFLYFEKSKIIAEQVGSTQLLINYYHGISDTYEKLGKHKEALQNFKLAKQLNDSVYNAEKSLQLVKMQTLYETEKKQLEIENLSQKSDIQQLEIQQREGLIYWIVFISLALIIFSILVFLQFKSKQKRKLAEAVINEQKKGINAVIYATEEERKRIAKDLHDGVGQQLSGLKLFFSKLREDLIRKEPELKNELVDFGEVLDEACTEVRSISHQMMPKTLTEKGLVDAIEDMLNKSLGLSDIKYQFEHFGITKRFDERIEISIYRISQELVNNVIKHSGANHVSVQLIKNKKHLVLLVEDNGKGFAQKKSNDGIGHLNMSSRINTLNGSFSYDSETGRGTVATIRIPI